jgi:hypothetical protein
MERFFPSSASNEKETASGSPASDDWLEQAIARLNAEAEESLRKNQAASRRQARQGWEELGLQPRRTSFGEAEREALADEAQAKEELGPEGSEES